MNDAMKALEYLLDRIPYAESMASAVEITRRFETVRAALEAKAEPVAIVEPTAEMQAAGAAAIRFDTTDINKLWTANTVYRAMMNAAPPRTAERCCCQSPEPESGAAGVSNCCPVHNENPHPCCSPSTAEVRAQVLSFSEAKAISHVPEVSHALRNFSRDSTEVNAAWLIEMVSAALADQEAKRIREEG